MGISHSHAKKSPTNNPTDFFKLKVQGSTYGTPKSVGDTLKSGPMREQLMGNPKLSGSMDPSASTRTGGSGKKRQ